MTKIDKKIVAYHVVDQTTKPAPPPPEKPRMIDRPDILDSKTYRLKTPLSEHALYITISDIVKDDQRRPFEIFINCKSMENFQWIVALTRVISAVFRTEENPQFVAQELKEVFDPRGGYWKKGHIVPSLVAEIGMVIEQHLQPAPPVAAPEDLEYNTKEPDQVFSPDFPDHAKVCERCGIKASVKMDGCATCLACGDSKCG